MNAPLHPIRRHPQGGYTVAVPVPGSITAHVYVGQFSNSAAAHEASRQLSHQPAVPAQAPQKELLPC